MYTEIKYWVGLYGLCSSLVGPYTLLLMSVNRNYKRLKVIIFWYIETCKKTLPHNKTVHLSCIKLSNKRIKYWKLNILGTIYPEVNMSTGPGTVHTRSTQRTTSCVTSRSDYFRRKNKEKTIKHKSNYVHTSEKRFVIRSFL